MPRRFAAAAHARWAATKRLIHLMAPADDKSSSRPALRHPGERRDLKLDHDARTGRPRRSSNVTRPPPPRPPPIAPMLATAGAAQDVQHGDWVFGGSSGRLPGSGYGEGDGTVRLASRRGLDLRRTSLDSLNWPDSSRHTGPCSTWGRSARRHRPAQLRAAAGRASEHRGGGDALHGVRPPSSSTDARSCDPTPPGVSNWPALLGDGTRRIQLSTQLGTDADEALAISRELGLEGVVAKRPDWRLSAGPPGAPGSRSSTCSPRSGDHRRTPGESARARTIGALLMAVPDGDALTTSDESGQASPRRT